MQRSFHQSSLWPLSLLALLLALLVGIGLQPASAQTTASPPGPPSSKAAPRAATPPQPAAAPKRKARTAPAAQAPQQQAAPLLQGTGYRSGPIPAWVAELATPLPAGGTPAAAAGASARRDLLVDIQHRVGPPKPQYFSRIRAVATDAQTLGSVSQAQISFNPAFQTVVLHHALVWRDGQAQDRLRDARHELMRREQRLEQQVIDGVQTLLLILSDVRVGEVVEWAYTVEGDNPIYEGRISGGFQLGWDSPIDLLHVRLDAPADRSIQTRVLAGDFQPERSAVDSADGGRQIVRLLRRDVPAQLREWASPPWFKIYPALDYSDYRDWEDVNAWSARLFALPAVPDAAVLALAEALRASGKTGAALVDEALRFVQDEIRYFSASLGESSHRPKPAERTLADGFGDCKDKTQLLNALLRTLGFDARPALVSMQRNRGLGQFLPGHDQFDHVVTWLQLDGQVRYLDATLGSQGQGLGSRGYFPYGQALVEGLGPGLQPALPPADAVNELAFLQRWDLRKPGLPAALEVSAQGRGLAAEGLRASLAQGGAQRLAEALGNAHARVLPGLKPVGEPEVADDRAANTVRLLQRFEHPDLGQVERGALELEFGAVELLDTLVGPPETQRRTPFMIDQPAIVSSRIEVLPPLAPGFKAPAPVEFANKHFRYVSRTEVTPALIAFDRRWERRSDEVLPADLAGFREQTQRARQASASRLRLALAPLAELEPEFERIDRRLRGQRGARQDALHGLLLRHEVVQLLGTQALERVAPASPLAARLQAERAISRNLLGQFAASLQDADAALAQLPTHEPALEARGVALLGLGRWEEALAAFEAASQAGSERASALNWIGAAHLLRGEPALAEAALREAVDNGGGESREFALLWLYLAAERQGRGAAAIAPHLDGADMDKLTGQLLHFLAGRTDRAALLKFAQRKPDMARLDLAEAHFFIAMQHWVRGEIEPARRGWQDVVAIGATPYREHTFAQLLLAAHPGR